MAIEQTPDPTYALAKPAFNRFAGKCDGNHGMPECSSLICWHKHPPIDLWRWQGGAPSECEDPQGCLAVMDCALGCGAFGPVGERSPVAGEAANAR